MAIGAIVGQREGRGVKSQTGELPLIELRQGSVGELFVLPPDDACVVLGVFLRCTHAAEQDFPSLQDAPLPDLSALNLDAFDFDFAFHIVVRLPEARRARLAGRVSFRWPSVGL